MASIDIGTAAIVRGSFITTNQTVIAVSNPANASGKITSVEIYAETSMTNVKVATFYVKPTYIFTTRDYQYLGNVAEGAKRTFTVDLDVVIGDYIGIYYNAGNMYRDTTGSGYWSITEDYIPCTDVYMDKLDSKTISLYGTGATPTAGGNSIFMGCNF